MSEVIIYGNSWCHYTIEAVKKLPKATVCYLDRVNDGQEMRTDLVTLTGQTTVPYVFIGGKFIGGYDSI
jgi:glutaredoxin 3